MPLPHIRTPPQKHQNGKKFESLFKKQHEQQIKICEHEIRKLKVLKLLQPNDESIDREIANLEYDIATYLAKSLQTVKW